MYIYIYIYTYMYIYIYINFISLLFENFTKYKLNDETLKFCFISIYVDVHIHTYIHP